MKEDSVGQQEHELRHASVFICFNNGLLLLLEDSPQTDYMKCSLPPHHDSTPFISPCFGCSNLANPPCTSKIT